MYRKPNDFDSSLEIILGWGNLPGISRVSQVGNHPDADVAAIPEELFSLPGIYPFPSSAQSLEVVSDSASDSSAGTGARTLTLTLLDASYAPSTVTVTLDGLTPVAVPGTWLRINNMVVASAGSNLNNVGNVSLRIAGGGAILSYMVVGWGIQRQAIYTVPAGCTLGIRRFLLSINRTSAGTLNGHIEYGVRSPGGVLVFPAGLGVSSGSDTDSVSRPSVPIPEKYDVFLRIVALSTSNMNITAGFSGFLIDNAYL